MQSALPVALSAQLATEKRLETIANNIANARTVGFRAEEVKFEQLLSEAGSTPVAFASKGETFISTRTGELSQTGNTLDMAVNGDAWFGIQGANGTVYTRDGRMRVSEAGELQTLNGEAILDAGGAPMLIDPNGGPLNVARDGMITQGGQQLGAVGLFTIPANAKLSRAGTSGVVPDIAAVPLLDFAQAGVMQGYVEGSNVNPVLEMTRLITVQRAFESAAKLLQDSEGSLNDAVKSLGATS
ncbi:flagellar basal-body rod protein FlgF [Mangrovibrevibacter kandeliae]|uniref:flagellar basal-body rod protein FlgF n=1 Tax=Mangrovibrevibacter kandeliae TaxID=2968473 RepID=UPI002117C85E|nr:flagellar basal-body rod protein FlgF [Aurantimonas sp. CSK15Z-1]MCQ8780905.1 flagellar basal-body rod protein FlgF [Aurantimonas sp. CSK15Z-1]